jgi:hypothetical protein
MANYGKAKVGCQFVGEYVDEHDRPANLDCHQGEVVRPQVVAEYRDVCVGDDDSKEFTEG